MRLLIVSIVTVGIVGCGSEARLKAPSVGVTGKVTQSGRPVSGMAMIFHPLGDGHAREFPIQRDGTFRGELICGDYAYYVAKRAVPAAAQAPLKVSPKYFEADMSRTITVEPDKLLAIALDE